MNLGKETETLEFKKSTSEVKAAMDDICAILNKHGEGKLIFGVKPNGDVCGQEVGSESLDDVAKKIKEAIEPTIYPSIYEEEIDNKKCIVVNFKGKERPYSSYGRYFKRVVDRSEKMTSYELKRMMADTDFDSLWENNLTKHRVDDLDKEALLSYYNNAVSCGRLQKLDKYNEEVLLTHLGLMEDGYFNNAGYYLFSNKKPVVLKIATYVSDERINFSDIRRIEDNIYNLIRYAYTYIIDKMNWRVEKGEGVSRREIPEVPVDAIREIIVNSFAHADYRRVTENEIDITPTQIEIYNPGEFPLNMTPSMFVTGHKKSQPRNKVILNTLYKLKDAEMFGSGFKKVFKLCKENNVKFESIELDDGFSFIFYRKNESNKKIEEHNNKKYDNINLNSTDIKVLNLLKDDSKLTRDEMSKKIGVTTRTIQRTLDKLVNLNKLIRIGSKKVGYWEVLN